MNKTTWAGCALAMLLTACASPMEQADRKARQQQAGNAVKEKVNVPFDEGQAKAAMAKGSSRIKGVLYHKVAMSGKFAGTDSPLSPHPPKYLKGVKVMVFPETEHLKERLRLEKENRRERIFSKDAQVVEYIADPRMFKYSRTTKTDEHGRYFFNNLKPGKYYVVSEHVDVRSTGTSVVQDGVSVVTNGYFTSQAAHYRSQNYGVLTLVEYGEFLEIEPGKDELVVESRMRQQTGLGLLFDF